MDSLRIEINNFKELLDDEFVEETYMHFQKDIVMDEFSTYLTNIEDMKYYNHRAHEISELASTWGEIIREKYGELIVDSVVIDISEEKCYWYNTGENPPIYHWGYDDRVIYESHVAVGNEEYGKSTITGKFVIGKKVRKPFTLWKTRNLKIPYGHIFNSFGARKMELWEDGRYTMYACHGTNDTTSIGKHISLGCIRFFNKDALILFELIREKETAVYVKE